jgi:branched-chain amino acid transport system ATP-binding protein
MNADSSRRRDLLVLANLATGYRRKQVIFDVSLRVRHGEIVALIGHNGAGKTTTLKAAFGLLPVWHGQLLFDGESIAHLSTADRVRRGMAFLPQERPVFADLTVAENLNLGAFTIGSSKVAAARRESVFAVFPILAERRKQPAGTLSGGEQRMLSLAMAMMMRPRLLLLDEPSLGLAPALVRRIMDMIQGIARSEDLTVLLVEQNVGQALRIADQVYAMRTGRTILADSAAAVAARGQWWDLF